ncbi:hypothetical protein BGP84_08975 [Pseudomonas putida]|jgi:hypothetical protein|uniref:Uncharacterized protein n=1 Tax=Pseudomonas putida TaxID=303 RepID=A0A2S3X410_PSEPU|nr:hypothetical protein [Pseudomonas putida]POG09858.1 hypothetical protein BGP84_08975 [Pseudomonas putida]POG16002.1 hypothetical protein BGP85_07460 [Pseudomonas putida]
MSEVDEAPGTRAAFHRQHQAQAMAEAQRLLAQREAMGPGWLSWVAAQLYQLSPPPYAAMVRRELQRLAQG